MRSHEEAHIYMDLHGCSCGGSDARRDSALRLRDEVWLVGYRCVCEWCGAERMFEFRQPETLRQPGDQEWAVGSDPSELLDAGEWLMAADVYAGAPAQPDGLSPQEVEEARAELGLAVAALGEVLKFVPAGAGEVPASALWSGQGIALHESTPWRFTRESLEREQGVYRTIRAGLTR